jgi:transcription elongation factor GreA
MTMLDKPVYLTREGYERLRDELHELRDVRSPSVTARLRRAKELADTVDNAEYEDVRQDQAFVEGRIRDLERRLATAQLIAAEPAADRVRLGSRVTVVDDDGNAECYLIVGWAEADPRHGRISNESPVGHALLGRRVGEVVEISAPGGSFRLTITALA